MLTMRTGTEDSVPKTNPNPLVIEGTQKVSLYEQCREERIKENLQRMQNLGILNLSLKLKSETRPVKRPHGGYSNPGQKSIPLLHPSRRSSRLENPTPVIYTEVKSKKSKRKSVVIREGPRAEIYTEEHEKLLGNTERSWTSFVDGYGKDGKRIYDQVKGKTCHQCRQKTLGHRTRCSECDMVQGQFCGDCLIMRYGEHVLEALENPNWICPVCRGICNCSLCRNHKGWVPTGPIYRKIAKLGYKSVAHYLIQTKRLQTDDATPNQASAERSLSFQEAKQLCKSADDDLPEEVVPKLQDMENKNGDSFKKEEDENTNANPDSARRSLSFFLPSVDNQTSLFDVQVIGYLKPPKEEDKQVQERRPDIYLLSGENQTLVDLVLCNESETRGNSVKTRETRSKRKVSLEPNPDSIGGRLRQRRRSQSGKEEDENTNKNLSSAGRSLSLILPSVDHQTLLDHSYANNSDDVPKVQERTEKNSNLGIRTLSYLLPGENKHVQERRPDSYFSGENQTLVVDSQDLVLWDETETRCNSVKTRETRSKRKAALEPNPDSIGGRLRQRRRSQSGIENLNSAGRSLSLILLSVDHQTSLDHSCANVGGDDVRDVQERTEQNSDLDTRTLSYLLPLESQTLVVEVQNQVLCNKTETGGNSVNTREMRSSRKMALEPNQDSIGGRLRQRRRSQTGL